MDGSPSQAQDALTFKGVKEAVADLTSTIEDLRREVGDLLITLDLLREEVARLTDALTEEHWKPVLTDAHLSD